MFPCSPIPRPEYPRPDHQRGYVDGIDWLNLNGPWQFRFDPEREGEVEQWFAPGGPEWREQIVVPFCWESLAAWGEGEAAGNTNYYSTRVYRNPLEVTFENHRTARRQEVGWYRRHVELPADDYWRDRRIILHVGAADFFTDCWCNGVHLGRHEGGYVPFEFDLTDALLSPHGRLSHALIVFRVEDPMDHREQPVGKQWGWYTPTSGIWQTVYLEPRSPAYVAKFRITTDIDSGRVHFLVRCHAAPAGSRVLVEIIPPEAPPHQVELQVSDDEAAGGADVYPVSLWDTTKPRLYHVIFRLFDEDRELDVVRSYFGMRKIGTTEDGETDAPSMLALNNQPIYLRGALYQSYHPEGVYTAAKAGTLQRDIRYAKEMGFDFLRIHIKLDDPLVLYYADTEGILIMQDFPNFGEGGDTPLGRRRFEEMMRLGIERDCNHPSIIAWCIFNETWGFGGQTELMKLITPKMETPATAQAATKVMNTESFKWVHEMWQLAKSLDPTRLIEDMSVVVWEHLATYGHVDTDINSWHFYIDDYHKAKEHIENVVAETYHGSTFNYIEGYQQKGAPLINSEYGGVGALDGDRDVSWSFRFLTNELRRHGQLSAYIYTELHDTEWEYNGFLNYDRTPKEFGYPPTIVNQGDVLPINAPPISRCTLGENVEVEVLSSHFSRRSREDVTLHWLFSGIDTLGTVHAELARGRLPISFTHHHVELAAQLKLRMPAQPMLCTLAVTAVTSDGEPVAANYIQHFVDAPPLAEREERGNTLILRETAHTWSDARWSGASTTPAKAEERRSCGGHGWGYFEWNFAADELRDLRRARRLRVLCEVSSCRTDTPQTDSDCYPTCFEMSLGGLTVHRALLPDHPHDSRGALSYLNNNRGAYGYLMRSTIEDDLLQQVVARAQHGHLRLRCAVPKQTDSHGGLTVYDYDCGRYPVPPTLVIEWGQS